jgi:hypothetical protein
MKLPLLAFACALFCGSLLNAGSIIYTNFADNFGYTTVSGLNAGPGSAVPFTETLHPGNGFTYVLSGITVAAFNTSTPTTDPLTVSLYADSNGLPGTLLASQGVFLADSSSEVVSVSFDNGPILSDGTHYWVGLSDPDGNATWNFNDTIGGVTATYSTESSQWLSNGTSYAPGAVEVDGSLVAATPEPGSFAMIGGGLIALIMLGARRRSLDSATGPAA